MTHWTDRGRCWEMLLHLKNLCLCPCSTFSYPCSNSLSSLSLKRCWWFSPLQFCCNLCLTTTMLQVHWNALQCTKVHCVAKNWLASLAHTNIVHILHSARSHLVQFAHFVQCTLRFCPFYTFCRVREQAGGEFWPSLSHLILFAVNPLHLTSAALNYDKSISRP